MAETSRDTILQALRAKKREPVELPDLDQAWMRFDDPVAKFAEVLEAVGGRCLHAANWQEVNHQLDQLPAFQQARWIGSSAGEIDRVNFDVNSATDPQHSSGRSSSVNWMPSIEASSLRTLLKGPLTSSLAAPKRSSRWP